MGTAERRLEIYKYLCFERKSTMPNLAKMFGVSVRTIQRDIFEIEATFHAPIEVTKGKYGGVAIVGDHRFDRAYMCEEELLLLKKVQLLTEEHLSVQENLLLANIIKKYSKSA